MSRHVNASPAQALPHSTAKPQLELDGDKCRESLTDLALLGRRAAKTFLR